MSDIFRLRNGRSRAINAENPTGEKGKGGIAASHLGPSRKGSPCLKNIMPNETVVLAEMDGPGIIQHIWITVNNKTSDADCYVRLTVLEVISSAVVLQENVLLHLCQYP